MTSNIATPLVKIFGNSLIFGDKLGDIPVIFQPFLFYPDWFFMAWPFQFIGACLSPNTHPYMQGFGVAVWGFGFLFFVLGAILGAHGISDTFTRFAEINRWPISRDLIQNMHRKGALGQLLVLPLVIVNFVYFVIFKTVISLLFWHIVIARVAALFATFGGRIGLELSDIVGKVFLAIMLVPPIINMIVSTASLLTYFIRLHV